MKIRTAPQEHVAIQLAETIATHLSEGKRVLWLLSGGSGGDVCVRASHLLRGTALDNLWVTMSDERYGPQGHPDENSAILEEKGLELPGATLYRPLINATKEETLSRYSQWLRDAFTATDYHIALLGIGEDAHTAGIKPRSQAIESSLPAELYTAEDFDRLTVTPAFLATFDEAIVQAYGANKEPVIKRLLKNNEPIEDNPSLLVYTIPTVTVYSDLKEGESI